MATFATLKKSSSDLDRLTKEIDKINTPASTKEEDTRFWKIERDKSGNGAAIIRFLPENSVDGEDALPWIRFWDHGFQGPDEKWYIENSLTTLGQKVKDPVSEFNSWLWNRESFDGSPSRKQAQKQKRRLHYISNILVISDPKHPEFDGTVKLYKYGKKIFDKITLAMNPEFEGDAKINPFDFWKGANFKLRIRTVDNYPSYNESLFESQSVLADNDKKLEEIWKNEYPIKEFIAADKFKTYDELKERLDMVLENDPLYQEFLSKASKTIKVPGTAVKTERTVAKSTPVKEETPPFAVDEDDDDADLKAFKALAS